MKTILFSLLILLVFGTGAYYGYNTYFVSAEPEAAAPELQTAQVRRGDLVLTAGGIGTLFAGEETQVGFRSSGIVSTIAAQVGDQVDSDQILATLAYDSTLNSQLISARINLRLAEIALIELTGEVGGAELAAAQSSLAAAQAEYDRLVAPPTAEEVNAARSELVSAQSALNSLLAGPSEDTITSLQADLKSAEVALAEAQSAYDRVAWRNDVGRTSQAADLQAATLAYEKALAQYNIGAAGAAVDQVESARARVLQAQNSLNLLLQEADELDEAGLEEVWQAFHALHEQEYGHCFTESPIEIVNIRITGVGSMPKIAAPPAPAGGSLADARVKTARSVFRVDGALEGYDTAFYMRESLPVEAPFPGPAVILQTDATTVVPPGWAVRVDTSANLILRLGEEG